MNKFRCWNDILVYINSVVKCLPVSIQCMHNTEHAQCVKRCILNGDHFFWQQIRQETRDRRNNLLNGISPKFCLFAGWFRWWFFRMFTWRWRRCGCWWWWCSTCDRNDSRIARTATARLAVCVWTLLLLDWSIINGVLLNPNACIACK